MATPQSLTTEQTEYASSGKRLVWVLNKDHMPYTGTYGGVKITIPPNHEKIAKRAADGGNLMPYLEARRFITDFLEPQGFGTDPQTGDRFPILMRDGTRWPKALYDKDLTAEEALQIVGKTAEQLKKEAQKELIAEDKKAKRNFDKNIPSKIGKISLENEDDA